MRTLLFLMIASISFAEQLQERNEPVPSDKCSSSVIASEDERLYVFALSEDSVVWYKFQKAEGGWSTWRPLSNRIKMGGGPQVVRYSNGTIQVFARGADRLFYYTTMTSVNVWSEWKSPFGDLKFSSNPVPIVTASDSLLLFGVPLDSLSLWMVESYPITSETFMFQTPTNLGGNSTSTPSVLLDSEGLVHVFIRGANRALWHINEFYPRADFVQAGQVKSWSKWECLGGVLASSPKIVSTLNGANLIEVYVRAADKALWKRSQASDFDGILEWSPWSSLGGVLSSGPSHVLGDAGNVAIFARATDRSIYLKVQTDQQGTDSQFNPWHGLGGMFSTTPSSVIRADGMVHLFSRGVDKAIWHCHQMESNGTRVFSTWHSLGGHTRKFTC